LALHQIDGEKAIRKFLIGKLFEWKILCGGFF
jgi:hypothetical protein